MILEIYNNEKELVNTITDAEWVKNNFLSLIFNKYIAKSKGIKQVQYNYNFSDRQTITFIHDNGFRSTFKDIPTQCGLLDINRI